VPIDHLLHSEALVAYDRQLGPELGSDHLPLVVDLAIEGLS
jgi:endonuclease/exonuclease/phosphatase (EEP) superfamily protein YafD